MTKPLCRVLCVLLSLALAAAAGCDALQHLTTALPEAGEGQQADPRYYPDQAPLGQSLDVQITRTGRRQIALDNRTAGAYRDVTLWLNEQYGATIDEVPVGKGPTLNLLQFINQHGEPFPTGSFLSPELSREIVDAGFEIDGRIHPLTVRLREDWREQ